MDYPNFDQLARAMTYGGFPAFCPAACGRLGYCQPDGISRHRIGASRWQSDDKNKDKKKDKDSDNDKGGE